MKKGIWSATAILLTSVFHANAIETTTTLEQQQAVAVTIYNENLALVKDTRKLSLPTGESRLSFRDVSALIRPETAFLRNIDAPGTVSVIEQNFDYDLLSPQKMVEKFLGKTIQIATMNPATGKEKIEKAKILSIQNGIVAKIGQRIETNPKGRFIFSEIPPNLRDRPTLSILLNNSSKKTEQFELSYLTNGLSWKADYVAELNSDDSRLDLLGWISLNNGSGTSYNNAKLQLVAGDVNRVRPHLTRRRFDAEMAVSNVKAQSAREEALFEYHLYTLERPTTIADNQNKQVSLLNASSVKVDKEYLLEGRSYYYFGRHPQLEQKLKTNVFINLANTESNNLGMALPKGVVRVYKKDLDGNAQFIGEDRIDHTPKNEKIRLKLGKAFDITARKTQTDYRKKRPSRAHYSHASESDYTIEIKNAKEEKITVLIREPIPGDWKILAENFPHKKVSAGMAEWAVTIPAEGKTTLSYSVLTER